MGSRRNPAPHSAPTRHTSDRPTVRLMREGAKGRMNLVDWAEVARRLASRFPPTHLSETAAGQAPPGAPRGKGAPRGDARRTFPTQS